MKRIFPLALFTWFSFLTVITGQKVWFIDAGAGIVSASPVGTDYTYVVFNGMFFPDNIVVDKKNGKVYWTDWTKDKLRRSDLDGRNVKDIIVGIDNPKGMALDTQNQMLYWVESISGTVHKATTSGTMQEILISDLSLAEDIVVDVAGNQLFVTTSQGIYRIKTDGSESVLILPGGNIAAIDFNPTTRHVYYGSESGNGIKRMNVDGTGVQDVITGTGEYIDGLFYDPIFEKLYWADYTGQKLFRANLNGTERETLITAEESGISDVYFDAADNMLYWVEPSNSELLKKSLTTGEKHKIIDGDRWGQISDISLSPIQQKLFFLDRDSESIVSVNWQGQNEKVILDSLDGVVSMIFDAYGNDIYWSDRLDKIIYRSDVNGNNITPLIPNVDVISMDIDFVTKTMYFIDLTDKKIKYANLDNPVVHTIANPGLTVPEDLAVQMETRKLFWIDDKDEDMYRMDLVTRQHQLYFNQATNLTYVEATESLSGLFFIDAGQIIYTDDVNPNAIPVYYPGEIFPHSIRVSEHAFIFPLIPAYDASGELLCSGDSVTVTIDPYGAIPTVTYTWSDGYVSTDAVRTGVKEGIYTVSIEDLIDRTAMLTIELTSQFESPAVEVELEHAALPVLGSAQSIITGGQPPYTLLWEGDGVHVENVSMIDQLEPGEYSLTVEDQNGCATKISFTVELISSNDQVSIPGLKVFPTLTHDFIQIVTDPGEGNSIFGYEIFDMHARMLKKENLSEGNMIDVSGLTSGMYSLKLNAGNQSQLIRFVKL